MSDHRYTIEFAKSSRSKCKKCKEPIMKGEIRIVALIPGEPYDSTFNYHPTCFNLPKQYGQGANKITAEEFVEDVLEDASTGGEILGSPAKADEIAKAIATKHSHKKADGEEVDPVAEIRTAFQEMEEEEADDSKPAAKKLKMDDEMSQKIELYGKYHKCTIPELKDLLRWNRQVMKGTKKVVLAKVIDGELRGRLARCPLCAGILKLTTPDCKHVICSGDFDEDTHMRIECAYRAEPSDAPRWPWFTSEPSEEEAKEMDHREAVAKGEDAGDVASSPDVAELIEAASKFEWQPSSRDGLRLAATDMTELLLNHKGKKIDIPEDPIQAKRKVGQLIAANRLMTVSEVIPLIVKEFGFKEDKEKKAAKKQAAIEGSVKVAKNGSLIAAFQELSELYFKEDSKQTGAVYVKVVKALKDLDFEVTEENAMSLSKGKTKVPGIGKATAEKMKEFLTTGTMEKLEQKRAEAA